MTQILLVEDNRGDARLFAELLAEIPGRPFQATHAETLADARAKLPGHDIVFLDLSLPDAHGLETVTGMLAASRSVPIVVLTGTDDRRTASEAVAAGAQDYLTKAEITPSLLERTVRYALERKRAEDDARRLAVADEAARRARFLARVMHAIAGSFDLDTTLPEVARLLVPTLGDYCVIDRVRGTQIARVAMAAADPGDEPPLAELCRYVPGAGHPRSPVSQVIATGTAVWIERLDPDELAPDARYRELCARLAPETLLVTPLVARGRVVGAISVAMGPSHRVYDEQLRRLVEEACERIALGVDNAELYATAQRAIRGRDELLAVVSHDLRNPLGVVELALGMIQEEPATLEMALPRARRAVERMLHLIEDLLQLARLDAGTLPIEARPTAVAAILEDAYEQHRVLAHERGIALVLACETRAAARIDRHRMGQVLANLVGNALKFTPRGGTVRLSAQEQAERVVLAVEDTGQGIPLEHLAHVFDRFWQAEDSSHRQQGVGLGLAIVKGIVDAHGGSIQVDSTVGRGTVFRIELPGVSAAAA